MVVTVAALQDEVNTLRDQLIQRDAKIAQLNDLLKQALQREFGASSEKIPSENHEFRDDEGCKNRG